MRNEGKKSLNTNVYGEGIEAVRDEVENAVLNWDNDDPNVLIGGIMHIITTVFDPENQPNAFDIEPFKFSEKE